MENDSRGITRVWDQFVYTRKNEIMDNVNDTELQAEEAKASKLYEDLRKRLTPELWDLVNELMESETACSSRLSYFLYKQAFRDGIEFNKELGGMQI